MANVRCPMCSKSNPPEAEVCAYCGARLKPLRPSLSGQPPVEPKKGAGVPASGEADWLSQLRTDGPGSASEEDTPGSSTEPFTENVDVPDWLARIRDRTRTDVGPSSDLSDEGKEEEPDWIKGIKSESASDENLNDWLNRMPGGQSTGPEPSSPAKPPQGSANLPPVEPSAVESEPPDWLSGLSQETPGPETAGNPPPPFELGTSSDAGSDDDDWMRKLSAWQAGLTEEDTTGPAASDPFTAPAEEGKEQWSAQEGEPPAERPSSGFGITGFLSNMDDKESRDRQASQSQPQTGEWDENVFPGGEQSSAAAPAEGIPDWLKGLDSDLPGEPSAGGPAEEPDMPDWLRGTFTQPSSAASETGETGAGKSELPDWLSAAGGQPQVYQTADSEPVTFEPKAEEPPSSGFASEQAIAAASEDLPDWFASFEKEDVDKTLLGAPLDERAPGTDQPGQAAHLVDEQPAHQEQPMQSEMAEEGEVPDWLSEFQGQRSEEADALVSPLIGSDKDLEQPAEAGEQPFTVDLPEWLGKETDSGAVEGSDQPAEPAGEELAHAELPEWVKEMRPLESILPGETSTAEADQRVEKAGPLAGLRGVLPVEDLAARYSKPPTYTIKLHVTEKQRSQSSLLDTILAEESQPLAIPPVRSRATGILVRLLVALILVVVLAIPVVLDVGPLAAPAPALFPSENQMFQKIQQGTQSSAPVLLAIEYEPALSGEMRLAASAVVEQLMAKNATIVLISTTPAGPALGQQLLSDAAVSYQARTKNEYNLAEKSVNLGYLPGGTISLLDLVQQPQLAAPAWGQSTLLKGVSGLSGFSQVIVLTDRAEVGRSWVEQVQPQLGKTPLLVVASTQAAPLLQPYVDSGQIAGMTGGLLGGVIYAQMAGQSSRALGYLPAYQVGIVLAFLVVLVGGLISAGMSLVRRSDREEE